MLTPRNANQSTIPSPMSATRERHEPPAAARVAPTVREEAVRFGSEGQLVGILTHPPAASAASIAARQAPTPALAFIILNAGVLHRVGPHRLHVALARRIAGDGVHGLRLDLGGIGDSITTSDAASFRESAVADTQVAMTGLTTMVGAGRFVLFGVCAGADNAIATALVDERVVGIALVDPPAYPTRRGQLRYLRTRAGEIGSPRDLVRWAARAAARRLRIAATMVGRRDVDDPPSEGREMPPIATYRAQLTRLVERGVRVFSIYSGIHGPRYNHPDQLFELFPALRGRVDRMYAAGANHTFTELAAQAELVDSVGGWMRTRFG
jgi:hypothetical protein